MPRLLGGLSSSVLPPRCTSYSTSSYQADESQGQERICIVQNVSRGDRTLFHRNSARFVSPLRLYRGISADASALAKFENHDTKLEPDLRAIGSLKTADQICHLSQRYVSTAIIPLAGSNVAIRREMGSVNSLNISRLEGKINAVIQRSIDSEYISQMGLSVLMTGITAWLAILLGKQKKNDYRPKDEEMSFARNNTEPCTLSCEFLETVRESAREGLSGKNAEVFLTEVGVLFHTYILSINLRRAELMGRLLLDHYKKFPVNPTGGLMLTKYVLCRIHCFSLTIQGPGFLPGHHLYIFHPDLE